MLYGEAMVIPEDLEPMNFGEGDLVICQAGLKCKWNVHKVVSKYYLLGDYIHLL